MRAPLPDVDDLANRVSLHVERGPPLVRMVLDRFSEDAFVREFRDGDAKRPCQKCGRGKKLGLFEVTSRRVSPLTIEYETLCPQLSLLLTARGPPSLGQWLLRVGLCGVFVSSVVAEWRPDG